MIRAGVLEEETTARLMAECPTCCGNGEVFVERLFGRNAPEPYLTRTCSSCGGSGEVDAEAVVYCTDCGVPVWADQVCTHQLGNLCGAHMPACGECAGDRSDR